MAPAESAPSKAAAKAAAKASAKAATAAAQKAAAKRAAKLKRALAAAPNPRMGLFQAFTHHPRKKRSASFKRWAPAGKPCFRVHISLFHHLSPIGTGSCNHPAYRVPLHLPLA